MTRYARAPSPQLEALLAPGGLLAPLLAPRVVQGLPLDPQLREKDHVHLYCGLPPAASPMEVWALDAASPRRLG